MQSADIDEVGIDEDGRLYITPIGATFPMIYRAAMEVGWDQARNRLFSPPPREWSYEHWYRHILAAARDEYGCTLRLTKATRWTNISSPDMVAAMAAATG